MSKQRMLVLFSGGIDSTVLAWHLRAECHAELALLTINYGQKHTAELKAAAKLGGQLTLNHYYFAAGLDALTPGNALTDAKVIVPEGHYADPIQAQTVVPMRNTILLSMAVAWAVSQKTRVIAFGAHLGDQAIYADCRPEFLRSYNAMLAAQDLDVTVIAPFLSNRWHKTDIVRRGRQLGVPLEMTWSCYQPGKVPCQKCGACVERQEALDACVPGEPGQPAAL